MTRTWYRGILLAGLLAALVSSASGPVAGQQPPKNVEWRTYGSDLASTHYSPLDQVNASNFSKLTVAWRFKTDNLGPRPEYNLEATPLVAMSARCASPMK